MEENERKYVILPGVQVPDMKTMKEASSDFSEPGVGEIEIQMPRTFDTPKDEKRLTPDEIKRLQSLGEEVAENEERIAEESKRKMEAIMRSAVTQSASMDDLRKSATQNASEEKLAEIEQRQKEEEAKLAEEAEKQKMREERRAMQKKQLEEAKARAEKRAEEAASEPVSEPETTDAPEAVPETEQEPAPAEDPAPAPEPVQPVAEAPVDTDIDSTGVISSDEETFEDFGEFLDDN